MSKMTFREFKAVAQPPEILNRPEAERWYGVWVRKVSVIFSFLIYRFLPFVSPNSITMFMAIWGIIACLSILLPGIWGILAFFCGFQVWTILDSMDGELARAKKQFSDAGVFLDEIAHILIHTGTPLAIGAKFFFLSHQVLYLYLGITCAFLVSFASNFFYLGKFWMLKKKPRGKRKKNKEFFLASLLKKVWDHIEFNALGCVSLLIFIFKDKNALIPIAFFLFYILLGLGTNLWIIKNNYTALKSG